MIQLENGFKSFFDLIVHFYASTLFFFISDSLDGGVGNSNPWGWVRSRTKLYRARMQEILYVFTCDVVLFDWLTAVTSQWLPRFTGSYTMAVCCVFVMGVLLFSEIYLARLDGNRCQKLAICFFLMDIVILI